MSKVSGSYERVTLGVSQQVAQDRREGQHNEQVNCISDPVKGTVRRPGSVHETTTVVGDYDADKAEATLLDVRNFRSYDFLVGDTRYTIAYRNQAKPTDSESPFCFIFNKESRRFMPVSIESGNALVDSLLSGGVSAITNVGRYLYIAGNSIVPTFTVQDIIGSDANKSNAAAWVVSCKIQLK